MQKLKFRLYNRFSHSLSTRRKNFWKEAAAEVTI